MRRRALSVFSLWLGIVLAASPLGVLASPADSEASGRLSSASGALEQTDDPLNDLVKATGALGVYRRPDGTMVVVVPASGASTFRIASARALVPDLNVITQSLDLEPADIAAIQARVGSVDWTPAREIAEPVAIFDAQEGMVVIFSDAPIATFAAILDDYRGKVKYHGRGIRLTSRVADFSPHWGGARMVSPQASGYCSSGFSVLNSGGNPRMLTAGHCFLVNWTVNSPEGDSFGEVKNRGNYPLSDFELVGGAGINHGPSIYVGGNVGVQKKVASAGNPVSSGSYCSSGSSTYEQCDMSMVNSNTSVCLTDRWGVYGCRQNVMIFRGPPSNGVCGGDSGGPFYSYVESGARVRIAGLVFAGESFQNAWECYVYAEYTVIEKWSKISSELNVTIKTGN